MHFGDQPTNFVNYISFILISFFLFTRGLYYLKKNPEYQNTVAKSFILIIITLFCAKGVHTSLQYSEKLWPPDETHELLTLNAAHTFAEKGFASNSGLPDISKSHLYQDRSNNDRLSKVLPTEIPEPNIYTHLPAGPYWLVGSFVKVCGDSTLSCPRILSTITSILAMLFFASMIFNSLGPLKSIVIMFFILITPMTKNMLYTLHYANYTFSLFIVQLGFLLYVFKKKINLNRFHLMILFILGFIQGWFSFEYFFLIILSSLPLALLYSQLNEKEDKKRLLLAILFLITGYCFAFLLHIIQNSLYFGSILDAFKDLYMRGQTRLSAQPKAWEIGRISMLWNYFFIFPRSWYFFIINFPILLSAILILIWFEDISLTIKSPIKVNVKWVSPRRNYFVILTAFLASFLWIFIMFNHAADEIPHLPRILFFFYFVCILTILECISFENS